MTTELTPATYRRLGSSGLHVSAIALGTMQFGWTADEQTSFAIMDAFAEWGGTLVDTADSYSAWADGNAGGVSEEIIGRWLAARGNRDDLVIATKVRSPGGARFSQGRTTRYQREGLSRRWILKACEDSLRRLGIEHIDLYQAHTFDPYTPIEETLSAFTDLVRRGLVRYVGCSNFSAWRLMESLWASDARGLERFVSAQPEYSLAAPTRADFEREIAPACLAYGVGVLPYSPLAGGFLTGKYRRDQPLPDSVRAEGNKGRMSDQNWELVDSLVAVAEAHAATPAQVALAWLLTRPFVTAPIVGANSVEQLRSLLPAAALALAGDEVDRLDKVSSWPRARTELDGHEPF
ncbi:MAG TPA: aldo/keto reductase [Actinophytocola sp.]|jgi:aryl-alcohol dehydrogenase-like predicted oxidoreductase|uniref:aldo/keto reductase n=1 Tax=Actinophytocola sp. TaxID=1872138 RepID=UPI002E0CCA95|nr:aldo/keto reductase [Actinophytocola sp.]